MNGVLRAFPVVPRARYDGSGGAFPPLAAACQGLEGGAGGVGTWPVL